MSGRWEELAGALARTVREMGALTEELERLAVKRDRLVAEIDAALSMNAETQTRLVAPWLDERRRQSVEPGHGAETRRIVSSTGELTALSQPVGCAGPDQCVWWSDQRAHSHTADGVVQVYG